MNETNSSEDGRLDEFAKRFSGAIPELSDEAIARIEQSMGREMGRVTMLRFVRGFLGLAAAAVLLVAISLAVMQRHAGQRPDVAVEQPQPEPVPDRPLAEEDLLPVTAEEAVVEDHMIVAVAVPTPPDEEAEPLVPLDDYQSLIGDVN